MFVSTVGKGDSTRVYVFESYRENGKVKKKIVKKLGYLSELTKDDPDALENLKKQLQIVTLFVYILFFCYICSFN